MSETSQTLQIHHPVSEVWATLADFGSIARWAPNVDHSCLASEQTDGIGMVRRVQAGRLGLLERVARWEPGQRLGYAIEGLPPALGLVHNTWSLTDDAGMATTVTLTTTVNAGSRPPQQLVAKAAGRAMAKASNEMLHGLDHHLRSATP